MIVKKYNEIMSRPPEYRNNWVIGLTFSTFAIVLVSFAFYRGIFSIDSPIVAGENNKKVATEQSENIPSPIENGKQTFSAVFSEIKKQYEKFTENIASVIVPFVSSIEVYKQ